MNRTQGLVAISAISLSLSSFTACGEKTESTSKGFAFARFVPERSDDFAFENDKIAFRIYGPALKNSTERSGIDAWLKRVDYPIIDKWYAGNQKGVSYHTDHGEGYDPYKVGSSLGCGGLALWIDNKPAIANVYEKYEIITQNDDKVVVKMNYSWDELDKNYTETRLFTVEAGSQFFRVDSQIFLDGKPNKTEVCIGLTTHDGKAKVTLDEKNKWVSCWEKMDDSLLGTGIVLKHPVSGKAIDYKEENKDRSHALLIVPTDDQGKVSYYAGFGWTKAGVYKTEADWIQALKDKASR